MKTEHDVKPDGSKGHAINRSSFDKDTTENHRHSPTTECVPCTNKIDSDTCFTHYCSPNCTEVYTRTRPIVHMTTSESECTSKVVGINTIS